MQTFNPDHIGILLFLRFPKDSIPFSTVYFIWRFFWVGKFHLRGWWWVPKKVPSFFRRLLWVPPWVLPSVLSRDSPVFAGKRLLAAVPSGKLPLGERPGLGVNKLGRGCQKPWHTQWGEKSTLQGANDHISPIFFGTFESMIFRFPMVGYVGFLEWISIVNQCLGRAQVI